MVRSFGKKFACFLLSLSLIFTITSFGIVSAEGGVTAQATAEYVINNSYFTGDNTLHVDYTYSGDSQSAKLIAVTYSGANVVENLKIFDITSSAVADLEYSKPQGASVVKLFIWDGTDTMEPLSEVKQIENVATATPAVEKVDGTSGTPLGGFGAGAVKFNATAGTFAIMTQAPADAYDYSAWSGTKFQLYTSRNGSVKTVDTMTAKLADGRYDDDAIWPEHLVNFGATNDIQVNLKAFAPLDTGDTENYDNMSMPYAFYEMTLTNNLSTPAEAACAFQMSSSNTTYVEGKGLASSTRSIYADSSDDNAVITVGNDSGFTTSGQCNNSPSGSTNKVAVKVSLAANETKTIKFVLAWYDNSDPDRYYYLNNYTNSGDIADLGLKNFDSLKTNADTLVSKMRASNLPDWFKNQTLNTLVNMTNNSLYKKDGRVAFAEGEWTCFGTMDQMWHARQIVSELTPEFAWKELEYWARTQKSNGQIHHDLNHADYFSDKAKGSTLVAWDDAEHSDYRNIDKWVDLNCGFIISIYETYQMTGNDERLDFLWPYMKKAAQRVLDQVELYGNKTYPYTFDESENSYDAGGDPNPFNASVSAVAYKVMTILGEKKGESDIVSTYQTAYDTVVKSYHDRYLSDDSTAPAIWNLEDSNKPADSQGSESYFAGQWIAMSLKLDQIWSDEDTEYALAKLDKKYHPLYWGMGTKYTTYDEWTPYQLVHYGGLLINTNREKQWEKMQRDAYGRQYNNRNFVFNHPLDILAKVTTNNYKSTDIGGGKQYISMPAQWRNYYDIVGYHRDVTTKELWVKPVMMQEMNHVMTNAAFISPEGYGSISCTESGTYYQNKNIVVKSDNPIQVSKLYLEDKFGENVTVTIDDKNYNFTRSGEGYTKELVVDFNGTIDSNGINIVTSGDTGMVIPADPYIDPPNPVDPLCGPDDNVIPGQSKDAYNDIMATLADDFSNTELVTDPEYYVTSCNNFDTLKFDNVQFGDIGASTFFANLNNVVAGGGIEIVLDGVGGDVVGKLQLPTAYSGTTWKEYSCTLDEEITGTHSVILRFFGVTGNIMDIKSIRFLEAGSMDKSKWTATGSGSQSPNAYKAFDEDITTRWDSHAMQVNGQYFALDMKSIQTFNKIVLDSDDQEHDPVTYATESAVSDYPRGYTVSVSSDNKTFTPVATGEGSSTGATVITFPTQTARYIKIVQTGTAADCYWSIHEINIVNE